MQRAREQKKREKQLFLFFVSGSRANSALINLVCAVFDNLSAYIAIM
jgi:hypothetical protein